MEFIVKTFDELTSRELYELYYLRVSVFVVEQKCAYQEVDELDLKAFHLYLKEEGEIKAYLRILHNNDEAKIGRVISKKKGGGRAIMQYALKYIYTRLNMSKISLEAQCCAQGFYEKFGFKSVGERFLEDGIWHIKMIKIENI
ncbi:GNAT family N-acetyltransferase [Helicobacter cholecystus]|uniref:GNAT family N-acetyltransferase n=1 Tax=Helicobacter cholecystus TaxID=45498 RepID=A0A3D8IXZ1_9HELI|nr:GNAT family N-acetyltransferase [Helicobacter cholecystus]RDU69421.1 GNAT family N-acetyltransferase [Helicobacter cholecystus]VEJ23969.1 putative acyltransferase [Helicobacter cholecystus]